MKTGSKILLCLFVFFSFANPFTLWAKEPIQEGIYQIVSAQDPSMVMNADGQMSLLSNSEHSKWKVTTNKKGKSVIKNLETNQTLKIDGQSWRLTTTKKGVQIVSDDRYLKLKDGNTTVSDSQSSDWKLVPASGWQGDVLNASNGTVVGPNGKETYYNLDMSVIVSTLQERGFQGNYWEREDGAKMFGEYILVAANYELHPYGSIVETSMGMAIVADTGGFAAANPTQIDIATSW